MSSLACCFIACVLCSAATNSSKLMHSVDCAEPGGKPEALRSEWTILVAGSVRVQLSLSLNAERYRSIGSRTSARRMMCFIPGGTCVESRDVFGHHLATL